MSTVSTLCAGVIALGFTWWQPPPSPEVSPARSAIRDVPEGDSSSCAPPFRSRFRSKARDRLVVERGGNAESEAGIARGLHWLAKQQREDGSWHFDGSQDKEVAAATGMALMAFLGAGETHEYSRKYQSTVDKGVKFLLSRVDESGKIAEAPTLFGQGVATVALCEAVGMTGDKKELRTKAQAAIDYIAKAQAPDGSWGSKPGEPGDIVVLGWQVQALWTAKMAELKVDRAVMQRAAGFLDKVGSKESSRYGFKEKDGATNFSSSIGLYCRQRINLWGFATPALVRGVDEFLNTGMPKKESFDIQFYYYASQVMLLYGGPAWFVKWNPARRDLLTSLQNKKQEDPKNYGSWAWELEDRNATGTGIHYGRLGVTCLSVLTLEVYVRYAPDEKPKTSGLELLDK